MMVLDNALGFFHACESAQGWAGCQAYVAENATFHSAALSYAEMGTLKDYCEQIRQVFTTVFAGSTYELAAHAYDADSGKVLLQGTSYARHTGEGGPVPANEQQATIPFAYVMTMDADNRIAHLEKIYDEVSGRRQLGWPDL